MGRGPLRGPPPLRHSGNVTAFPLNGGRGPSSEQPKPGSLSAAETRSGPGPSGYTAPGPDCWTPPPTICSGVPGFQQAGTGPELWNSAHGQHTLAARGPARRPCRPPAHTKPAHSPLPSPSAALPDDAGLSQRLQEDMATSLPTQGGRGGVSGGNQKGPGFVSWGQQGPWPGAARSQSPVSVFWGKLTHTYTHSPPWGELQPEGPQPSRGGGTRGSEAGSFWAPHPHASQSTPSYLPITQCLMPGPGANEQTELCLAGCGPGERGTGWWRPTDGKQ